MRLRWESHCINAAYGKNQGLFNVKGQTQDLPCSGKTIFNSQGRLWVVSVDCFPCIHKTVYCCNLFLVNQFVPTALKWGEEGYLLEPLLGGIYLRWRGPEIGLLEILIQEVHDFMINSPRKLTNKKLPPPVNDLLQSKVSYKIIRKFEMNLWNSKNVAIPLHI